MEKSVKALQPSPEIEDIQKAWPLTDYEYQSLRDDIKAHGIRNPLLIYENDGQLYILAGFHRWKIAGELGLDTVPVEYYAGTDTTDARRQYAILENMARRQVTTETKKALAKIYLKGNPRASDRAIGKITGLDGKTIAQVRATCGNSAHPKRVDTKGREQPAKKPKRHMTLSKFTRQQEIKDLNHEDETIRNEALTAIQERSKRDIIETVHDGAQYIAALEFVLRHLPERPPKTWMPGQLEKARIMAAEIMKRLKHFDK